MELALCYAVFYMSFAFSISAEENTIQSGDEGENNAEILDHITELEELVQERPVETLVDLICDCKISETCGKERQNEPQDCYDLLQQGNTKSGKYNIYPFGNDGPLLVYCDMTTDGGGWTVFQRREDDSVDFFLGWEEYKNGFGYIGGDFWLGNEHIFQLTNQERYELRVDMEDFEGGQAYALYDHFRISDEGAKYKLSIGTYSGTAGDSLSFSANADFSTKDQNNDQHRTANCANVHVGAWWFANCFRASLNAEYLGGAHDTSWKGIIWNTWKGSKYSLRRTEMKIRPFGLAT